jgi:hypothetical protein
LRPDRGRGAARLLAAVALSALAACGGGGGGGGGGPTQPPAGIFFTPAAGTATPAIVLTERADSTANTLYLEVRAVGVTDLYGLAFDLQYPASVLQFQAATEGTFLSASGTPTTFQAVESPAGNLVVGLSRLGDLAGADGSGLLLTLELQATAAGSGAFTFSGNTAFDHLGQPESSVDWRAGTVQVVR